MIKHESISKGDPSARWKKARACRMTPEGLMGAKDEAAMRGDFHNFCNPEGGSLL